MLKDWQVFFEVSFHDADLLQNYILKICSVKSDRLPLRSRNVWYIIGNIMNTTTLHWPKINRNCHSMTVTPWHSLTKIYMLWSGGKNKHHALYGQLCHMPMYSTKTPKHQRYNSIITFSKMTILETKVPRKYRNPYILYKFSDFFFFELSSEVHVSSLILVVFFFGVFIQLVLLNIFMLFSRRRMKKWQCQYLTTAINSKKLWHQHRIGLKFCRQLTTVIALTLKY